MVDFRTLLGALVENEVEFILVGGVAATVHGSARLTSDVVIRVKRAAGRPRDLETVAELEALRAAEDER